VDTCSILCAPQNKKRWNGVRGHPGVLHGAYQYEVELKDKGLLRVGWASATSLRSDIGKDPKSFGYGGTGKKATGGVFEPYGETFEALVGTVVTCLLDRRDPQHQMISYCLNGRSLGLAFVVPTELADVPLYPAICGRGDWHSTYCCTGSGLKFPQVGCRPLEEAVSEGDAVPGLPWPVGVPILPRKACSMVHPGQRVVLHVISGPWQGQHICKVEDVDALGCYVRHEDDDFTETVHWSSLGGQKYRMELLQENASHGGAQDHEDSDSGLPLGLLRRAQLQMGLLEDGGTVGAGVELVACEVGYLVKGIDLEPGQPGLHIGDVIVAIGETLLLNLSEDEIEQCFSAALFDGVDVVLASHPELMTVPVVQAQQDVEALLAKATGVVTTAARRVSRRDQNLLRLAASEQGKSRRCDGCNNWALLGKTSQDDGCFYCNECWQEWERKDARLLELGDVVQVQGLPDLPSLC